VIFVDILICSCFKFLSDI